jgi:DNA invertase Pin-like site-specific DNA recombinase
LIYHYDVVAQRTAIYARISKDDPDDPRLGVTRQREDLEREAARRGVEIVARLEDNDRSGSGEVTRPDFDRLIEMIRNREVDLVLAVDLDRLSRGWKPFATLYEACQEARIIVGWLGGEANFATGTGLLEMELRASFAREELRKLKTRTRRKHQELAEKGMDAGGGRPFGYEKDRLHIVESEALLIREAARRTLAGEPLRGICIDWARRKVATTNGRRWSSHVLKRILISARISGRRERVRVDGEKRKGLGEITAKATWLGIISIEDSDRLRATLMDPARSREAVPRKYLLAGLLTCGSCGKPMHSSTARKKTEKRQSQRRGYACIKGPGFSDGCGHIRINAEPLEALIVETLNQLADDGALTRALKARSEDPRLDQKLARVEAKLAELGRAFANGGSVIALRSATDELERERALLERQREAQRRRLSLDGLPKTALRGAWAAMPLERQRAVLQLLLKRIEIKPATRRGPVFDDQRVHVTWTDEKEVMPEPS